MQPSRPDYFVYSDGSFDAKTGIGVIGALIFDNPGDHHAGNIDRATLSVAAIFESSNIRVELRGGIAALTNAEAQIQGKRVPQLPRVALFTDCRAIVSLPSRRERLEASGYVAKRSGKLLGNSDLYREFYEIQDRIDLSIVWLKGHTSSAQLGVEARIFKHVDRLVRAELRRLL